MPGLTEDSGAAPFWRGAAFGFGAAWGLAVAGLVVLGTRGRRSGALRIGGESSVAVDNERATRVYLSPSGTRYHRKACRAVHDDAIELSRTDAEAQGREPCGVCKP